METIELVEVSSWEYSLFLVDKKDWVLSVPYPKTTMVDERVNVHLSDEQVKAFKKDSEWLTDFSYRVRANVSKYKANEYQVDVSTEYHKLKKSKK